MTLLKNANGTAGVTYSGLSILSQDIAVIREAPLNPEYPEFNGVVQEVIDHIGANAGEIHLPSNVYAENLTLSNGDITIRGEGWRTTKIRAASGDVVTLAAGSLGAVVMENLEIESAAGGGDCVVQLGNLDQPSFKNVRILQNNAAKHLYLLNLTGYLIDANFDHCDLRRAASASVPGIKWLSDNGEINKNVIGGGTRTTDSGTPSAPFFHFEEQSAGALMGSNVLRDINCENPRGGILRALSQHICIVDNVNPYDLAGATAADLFYFGKSAVGSAQRCRFPDVRNVQRVGAQALGGGFVDVRFVASECDYPNIDNGDHSSLGGGFAVDLGPNIGATFRLRNGVTLTNLDFNANGLLFGRGAGDDQVPQEIVMGTRLVKDNAAPATGTWAVGDRCVRLTPVVGQPKAWACTVAGAPGTWVSEGNL